MFRAADEPVLGPLGLRATEDAVTWHAPSRIVLDGHEFSAPLHIPELSLIAQVFSVPLRALGPVLEPAEVRPVEVLPGQGAVALMGVRYTDNPLGCYDEAVISFPVYPPGQAPRALDRLLGGLDVLTQRAAHLVYAMPVSQELTTHAGRALWGYPKFVAQLDYRQEGARATLDFAHEGEPVFGLSAPLSERGRWDGLAFSTLTRRNGVLRRIDLKAQASGVVMRPFGAVPTVGERHPLAQLLRSLGLPKRPLSTLSLRRASLTLAAATELSGELSGERSA